VADNTDNGFDVVILGAGSGGYACALRAAQLGMRVAMVEKDKVGGTCLHYGCIPTKALLHAGEVADEIRDGSTIGINASLDTIDMKGVNGYKDNVVGGLYKGLQGLVKAAKIDVVEGEGRMAGPNTVQVGDRQLTGRHVVLASGSYPRSLPGLAIEGRVMTSEQALSLDFVPDSVIIIGGSVIGVEFASVWRSFGADVTIVEMLPHLVPMEDETLSKNLERAFRRRKIDFRLGAKYESLTQDDNGVTLTLEGGDTIQAECVLVAVGRGPTTDGLGFAEQGITLDRGYVPTDERLRTNVPGVYAVGDLVPGLQLAHRGFAHGIFVAEDIAGLNPLPVVDSGIPRVTYCNPEVASVGLTEAQAREQYGEIETYEYNLAGNGRSKILQTAGLVKLVREKDGPIIGVHMIGARMGEQVGEASLIVNWDAYPEDVAQFIHAHPTQTETLGEAALALSGKPLHAHS
jgi:dihydrolipoamide dehydrogenase